MHRDNILSLLQKIFDGIFVAIFWYVSFILRFDFLPNGQQGLGDTFLKLTPILIAVTIYSFHKNALYSSQRFSSKFYEILSLFKANFTAVIGLVIILYFFGENRLSRLAILIYFLISTPGLTLLRLLIRNTLRSIRKRGHNLRHVLLVGNSDQIARYVKTAQNFKDSGIRFMGLIGDSKLAEENNLKLIKENYQEFRKNNIPDSIILSYSGKESYKNSEFMKTHYNDVIPIQLLPDLSYSMVGHKVEDFGGIPLLSVNRPSFNSYELFFKRTFEFLATLIGLIIISPLLFIISILVKISSPGPILFAQNRVGLDGKIFKMWKFRSMKMAKDGEDTKEWSNKENPRKTKFGNFLRKTSLDELPQLFNVLIGNMSLVGPRPEQPYFVEKFRNNIPGYMLKHKMRPGITGWAQVNGWRGDTSLDKRIECDIYYIKNWSFWLDVKIIFLTFWKGLVNKNAY